MNSVAASDPFLHLSRGSKVVYQGKPATVLAIHAGARLDILPEPERFRHSRPISGVGRGGEAGWHALPAEHPALQADARP